MALTLAGIACLAALALRGQGFTDFRIDSHEVQWHAFLSQGFASSNDNNYLTMKASGGSFDFRDGGVNISTSLTDKLRVGAQASTYQLGSLGALQPRLDWALVDYKFTSWFGVRAGRIKTSLGLYSDTQDMEFLHTWALLPPAVYPTDLRSSTLAHNGIDFYGELPPSRLGGFDYTAYIGARPDDGNDGYHYTTGEGSLVDITGRQKGIDMRWYPPAAGLMLGYSYEMTGWTWDYYSDGRNKPVTFWSTGSGLHYDSWYGNYQRGNWHFAAEARRLFDIEHDSYGEITNYSDFGFFGSAAYRVCKRLELGTYYSRYRTDETFGSDYNTMRDVATTARFDFTSFWHLKIEGHFMSGYGNGWSVRGFYAGANPDGLEPATNLLVIRTGFNI